MRFNCVITLLNITYTKDELNNQIENIVKRQIPAEKRSIRQSEVYQAAVANLKPEISFVIWAHEYKGETKIEYNGKVYSILRTFEPGLKIELYCGVKVGG